MTGASIGQRSGIQLRPFLLLFLGGPTVRLRLDSALALTERLASTTMLLGRDVLRHAKMSHDGASGRCTLSFAAT